MISTAIVNAPLLLCRPGGFRCVNDADVLHGWANGLFNQLIGDGLAISIVRLGSSRTSDEGLRLGTVRRPPRGVRKSEYASRNFYDVWLPVLSLSADLLRQWQASCDPHALSHFKKRFAAEMKTSEPARLLNLLAALSHQTNLSIGCYCEDEANCHRSVLRQLLMERGALVR